MLKIREIALSKNMMVHSDELAKAVQAVRIVQAAFSSDPQSKTADSYLLGAPHFELNYKKDIRQFVPVGQYESALKVFQKTHSKTSMIRDLESEYRAIVNALLDLGVTFRIVNLEAGNRKTVQWLRRKGCLSLEIPYEPITHWQIFPRDICVYLKEVHVLLVHANFFHIPSTRLNGCRIIHTIWGEGGLVLRAGDRMLLGHHPDTRRRPEDTRIIQYLRDVGLKVGFLPRPLSYGLSPKGEKTLVFHHSHIDLIGSLLKGKEGGFHLILDSEYRTGPLADPLSARESLDLVRRNCDASEIEVHVPRKSLSVPFATAMVQLGNGEVLMTGGDDEVPAVVADIVGAENVRLTDIPIARYPVFGGAGLHCLITENPAPLVSV